MGNTDVSKLSMVGGKTSEIAVSLPSHVRVVEFPYIYDPHCDEFSTQIDPLGLVLSSKNPVSHA